MMTHREVTQQQYENLLDDVTYLQDEAEALKYVIEQVPYSETPPDGMSIIDQLRFFDYLQVKYFRPFAERVFSENKVVRASSLDDLLKEFENLPEDPDDDKKDIFTVLNKIVKHRAALINVFKKIPLIDWERELKDSNGNPITLYDFASGMVQTERKILKEIADLVLIHQNEKLKTREINQRVEHRKSETN
jgi:hypothetical protein